MLLTLPWYGDRVPSSGGDSVIQLVQCGFLLVCFCPRPSCFSLQTNVLNKHLSSLMPGLTAKVFRTYNASITLQQQLKELTNSKSHPHYAVRTYVNYLKLWFVHHSNWTSTRSSKIVTLFQSCFMIIASKISWHKTFPAMADVYYEGSWCCMLLPTSYQGPTSCICTVSYYEVELWFLSLLDAESQSAGWHEVIWCVCVCVVDLKKNK